MALKIIGVHGLANKPPMQVLSNGWESALREGIVTSTDNKNPQLDYTMVCWADLMYAQPMHRKRGFEFDPLYNDEPYIPAAANALQEYEDGKFDDFRKFAGNVFGTILDLSHKAFGTDALSKFVIDRVLKDLSFYYDPKRKILNGEGKKEVARAVLMDEVRTALLAARDGYNGEIAVIAHSMGAIITYDVLRALGRGDPSFELEHFITIGAPLGLPTVKANVYEANKNRPKGDQLRTPTVVTKNWINYSDRKDPVCLDNHLSDDFGPNKHKVCVVDDIVLNDYRGTRNDQGSIVAKGKGKANHHKSYGYLRTPELSKFLGKLI